MTIHRDAKKAYKHELKESFRNNEYLPYTADGLIDFLFDDYSEFIVYNYNDESNYKTTLSQRLNRFWAVPLVYISLPFQWLITGKTGVSQHGKFGKWLADITGF